MLHPNWQAAMKTEYDALLTNSTWTLVPKPVNKRITSCKWIYKLKLKVDGSIDHFKACLVAKGFNQTYGIDYFETFCPVVKPTTIRIVLSLAISQDWLVKQLDVNNVFLNGELKEEVYMVQSPSFVDNSKLDFICKLYKALYGLKQAPRAWFTKLKNSLLAWGFSSSLSDSSMFLLRKGTDIIIILIYVDDIIVIGSNIVLVHQMVSSLHSQFAIKDLGILNYFLGVEVSWQGSSLHLS